MPKGKARGSEASSQERPVYPFASKKNGGREKGPEEAEILTSFSQGLAGKKKREKAENHLARRQGAAKEGISSGQNLNWATVKRPREKIRERQNQQKTSIGPKKEGSNDREKGR